MPPKEGIAIGTMISAPRPVDVRTGRSARIVVAKVIRAGRIRRLAAFTVASRISWTVAGFSLENTWSRYVEIMTPLSVAIPKRARKSTQTAADGL